MINKTFQLIRTNPGLTTNVKLVVNPEYKLYLESFDTNKQLSDEKYKHYLINKNVLYEDQIINFYDGLASNLAFDIKYDSDVSDVFSTYDKQFDDTYWSGAKSVDDNWYNEDYEYFAPLYIRKGDIPDGFIILRVDDSIPYDEVINEYGPSELNKNNFYNQIVDKWKCVNFFDMRYESDLGYFLHNNYVKNIGFPDKSFELDFREYEYSKIYGIDYNNGVYVTKSKFLKDLLYLEQPHFKLEKEILNSFKNNDLIFPNILNLKFLYNDVPASPTKINNYSLNRYYGFYIDKLESIVTLTSYITPEIKKNVKIYNNIFVDISGNTLVESPFVEGFLSDKTYWIQYNSEFYKVIRTYKDGEYIFQIVSNIDMTNIDLSTCNDNTCYINFESGSNFRCKTILNPSGYTNFISGYTDLKIDSYVENDVEKSMYGDLYLIKIDGIYHVLKERNGDYFIQSDYAINSYPDRLEYWKGGKNSKYYTKKNIYTYGEKPLSYPIYRLRFNDIKDFDFNIVNTHFADFDYEKDKYVSTPEHKLYAVDYDKNSLNKQFKIHPRGEFGQYQIMNISSEYISDDELYEISFNELTDIWRKNQSVVKWGVSGSNSNCDYPYKMNNSIDVGDTFNGTCNVVDNKPNIIEKNLDYFYRIGNFFSGETNNIIKYLVQTTNIEVDFMGDFSKKFNLELYLNSNVDYFDYFFKNKMNFEIDSLDYIKPTLKYSTFQGGDKYSFSNTLFKGISINAVSVKNITRDINGTILNIISDPSKNFNNYNFAIILNDVYEYYSGNTYIETVENGLMNNTIIDKNTDAIHVFMNDKYKNFLIVINVKIPMQQKYINFNNVAYFDEKYGIYNGKTNNDININYPVEKTYNPALITASNFIDAFNDMNTLSEFESGITYHYITNDPLSGVIQYGSTGPINIFESDNSMKKINSWGKAIPPFILTVNSPELLKTKKTSYIKNVIKGPSTNIYDKYSTFYDTEDKQIFNIIEPLAREMNINTLENNMNTVYTSNTVYNSNYIYRYNGSYEPIMNSIALFNNTYLYYSGTTGSSICQWNSNYKFDTSYENFGIIEELIFSKINPISPLKLKNTEDKSIYPMIDEYGLQYGARFIFNSSWDKDFYIITNDDQDINKNIFSNLNNLEHIINPLKPKK